MESITGLGEPGDIRREARGLNQSYHTHVSNHLFPTAVKQIQSEMQVPLSRGSWCSIGIERRNEERKNEPKNPPARRDTI